MAIRSSQSSQRRSRVATSDGVSVISRRAPIGTGNGTHHPGSIEGRPTAKSQRSESAPPATAHPYGISRQDQETGKRKVRVLVVDDHPIVRRGISACLARCAGVEISGEAVDGVEALAKARVLLPDVVLMDINMPRMGGLEATRRLQRELPQMKVLILSMQCDKASVLQIVRSGARGFILKDAPPEDLAQAVESISRGDAFFSPNVARFLLSQYVREAGEGPDDLLSKLTARELEVLTLIAEGQSNKEIASDLDVSVRTVEAHRERIMRKLNVHSAVALTRFAISHGLITLDQAESQ